MSPYREPAPVAPEEPSATELAGDVAKALRELAEAKRLEDERLQWEKTLRSYRRRQAWDAAFGPLCAVLATISFILLFWPLLWW